MELLRSHFPEVDEPESEVVKVPQQAWSKKRERQYEHIKDGLTDRGRSEDVAHLYAEAKQQNIQGRSRMTKAQLERALGR